MGERAGRRTRPLNPGSRRSGAFQEGGFVGFLWVLVGSCGIWPTRRRGGSNGVVYRGIAGPVWCVLSGFSGLSGFSLACLASSSSGLSGVRWVEGRATILPLCLGVQGLGSRPRGELGQCYLIECHNGPPVARKGSFLSGEPGSFRTGRTESAGCGLS